MSPMRDIYLIAKFSNMDIIILFLFNFTVPSTPPASRSTLPLPTQASLRRSKYSIFVTY